MNKTKIEWCDLTWNPMTGCKHGCSYCYARRIATRFAGTKAFPHGFEPVFYPGRLDEPILFGPHRAKIFVCSMADLFGDWVLEEHIQAVLDVCKQECGNIFIFLTKNPARYNNFILPPVNSWFGFSATNQEEYNSRMMVLPAGSTMSVRFVSLEPLQGHIDLSQAPSPDWLIIGGETGPKKTAPNPKITEDIVAQAHRRGIPVFVKDNALLPIPVKQFPARRSF